MHEELAGPTDGELYQVHWLIGPMSAGDWHRNTYLHVGYHLRQFGL